MNSNRRIDESSMANRKSCFMDNQGFLYRYDSASKSIIKTATLDGKPLATYTENGGLNGILSLEEAQDSSTLFVW